ncbi:AraC-like protein [Pseudomonas sp. SJZ079]|uniref:cupin domain-containing protein n=1 Tax=Pseudomonas sp. SJZ079 TaxID=2572887 RepID=UPI001199ACD7|nr:cupin domain-containing protein [Pseudomonas sp. SJZ079]TWC37736.1 AraC-like protein [Pseudomonas sp. SJZ079]
MSDIASIDPNLMLVAPLQASSRFAFSDHQHRALIASWADGERSLPGQATHFFIVYSGCLQVTRGEHTFELGAGLFASFPGPIQVRGDAQALIVSHQGYTGTTLLGGPVEDQGRLRYVDGCTSSLLLAPQTAGDPCLNFLHLPAHTAQTPHSHPSLRAGLILSGNGYCETELGLLAFEPGTLFVIPPGVRHSFQSTEQAMRIVIFHPDSDSGPSDTNHTMLNRTLVEGVSAQQLTHLHTLTEAQA